MSANWLVELLVEVWNVTLSDRWCLVDGAWCVHLRMRGTQEPWWKCIKLVWELTACEVYASLCHPICQLWLLFDQLPSDIRQKNILTSTDVYASMRHSLTWYINGFLKCGAWGGETSDGNPAQHLKHDRYSPDPAVSLAHHNASWCTHRRPAKQ